MNAVDKPVLTKRESLSKLLRMKTHFVHRKVCELDIYRNMLEVESTIRFRIQKEEKENASA